MYAKENALFYLVGKIKTPTVWTGGYAQSVSFLTGGELTKQTSQISLVTLDSQRNLSGSVWLGSAGWATFTGASIECQQDVYTQETVCSATGYLWSETSGWIVLGKNALGESHSGVYFDQNTQRLQGFAWSRGLGWVPLVTGVSIDDKASDNLGTTSTGTTL